MIGRRVYPGSDGALALAESDYAQDPENPAAWFIRPPGCHVGTIMNQKVTGNKNHHEVEEHEDGTITVSPSILCQGETHWHGYLERGVWRTC